MSKAMLGEVVPASIYEALTACKSIACESPFEVKLRMPSLDGLTTGNARIDERYYMRMRIYMIGNRMCAFALSAASAILCSAPPATAANYDGSWSMTAVTTRGHCGTIPIGMGISGGRIYSAGGSFAFYSIRLGGRVSNSGSISLKAVAGPRVAHGTGRLTPTYGRGTWKGRGPSGLCSGVWTATR